jgi:DNA-binding response OmpR family regulator
LILGPLETLLANARERKLRQALGMMHRNARRLQRLINQVLDLSKLQSGQMALRARSINVVAFVRTMVMAFASLAERKRIRLSFTAASKDIAAYVDRDKLEKILSNLISNALEFTKAGGRVEVAVVEEWESGRQGDEESGRQADLLFTPAPSLPLSRVVSISIKDTGLGIAPEHLEKIFDRFYQVDDSGTRDQEGTGIGLALARELVELHRGRIWAESEPGKGSTFFVHLPLGKKHLKPREIVEEEPTIDDITAEVAEDELGKAADSEPDPPASKDAPLLLIVEDNSDVRRYMRGRLQGAYRIIEAEDGVAAFERAVAEIPDVIISDVMMPRLDGLALCEKLKSDQRTSHIPVILLTARASGESKIEGLETGADDYIIKPFDVMELQARVKNLIAQRRRLRERFQREFILQPREVAVASADERFLRRAMEVAEAHMADPEFSVERFTRLIGMSTMQLHRKLKALTGQSATQFIRMVRLKRAAYLIEKRLGNVAEIAYEVGFNNPSYFAARFRELYGVSPSEYETRCTPSEPQ